MCNFLKIIVFWINQIRIEWLICVFWGISCVSLTFVYEKEKHRYRSYANLVCSLYDTVGGLTFNKNAFQCCLRASKLSPAIFCLVETSSDDTLPGSHIVLRHFFRLTLRLKTLSGCHFDRRHFVRLSLRPTTLCKPKFNQWSHLVQDSQTHGGYLVHTDLLDKKEPVVDKF